VLFHRDGKTATVTVVDHELTRHRGIRTNGKTDAEMTIDPREPPTADEPTMALLAALPMALHPQARKAACIGLGSGITTHVLLGNPRLTQVDTIEIEREMVRGAELFRPWNELAYTDPRSRIVVDDAKTFFAAQPVKYDLIVSEPSNPWVSGVANLFSDEFYKLVRRHLDGNGVFVQWIQLYETDVSLVVSVLKALEANFDDYVVYASSDLDLLVAASNGRSLGPPDPGVLAIPPIARILGRVGVRSPQDLQIRLVGTRKSWRGLGRAFAVPMNSDYAPVLDQNAARTRFLRLNALPLVVFARAFLPALEMLSGMRRADEQTAVTPSPDYDGSRRAWEAMWLRDVLLGRAEVASQVVAWPQLHDEARRLSGWMRTCDVPTVPLSSLIPIAQLLVPELTPAELDPIWASIASSCGGHLTPRGREWLAFFQATGRRDGPGMAIEARRLLAGDPYLTPALRRYLVAGGMLGSIAAGNRGDARDLWSRNAESVGAADDLLFQVLVAESRGE
jgi:hypothetical protein